MVLLCDAFDFKRLDVRLLERNIARGVLTTDDWRESLQDLPDDSFNAQWVNLDGLEDTLDEDERHELSGRYTR
jgi:hypothetical protein